MIQRAILGATLVFMFSAVSRAGQLVGGSPAIDSFPVAVNDLFSDRVDLGSAVAVQTTGTNVGFTGEPGEPAQSGLITSAWWQWTARGDGPLVVDTFGSDFDTFLTVAKGGAVNALTVLAQNDDSPGGGLQSSITLSVIEGATYQIAVDGFGSNTGSIVLNLVPEPSLVLLQLSSLCALLALRRVTSGNGEGAKRAQAVQGARANGRPVLRPWGSVRGCRSEGTRGVPALR